jgi:hypothetical protein
MATWAVVNSAFQQLDRVLYPDARKVEIPAPVFITGAARSGTTFFHRLLCLDDAHFEHFRLWEIAFPSITQKKLLRRAAELANRVAPSLSTAIEEWEQRQFQSVQDLHKFGFNMPEEDEFLFLMPFASASITVLFPVLDELQHLVMLDEQPDAERERLMKFYRECVEAQLYVHGGDRTLLSKNPAFVGKIRSVSEEFPDSKFIYMIRDPLETIPSVVCVRSCATTSMCIACCRTFLRIDTRSFDTKTWSALLKKRCAVSTRKWGSLFRASLRSGYTRPVSARRTESQRRRTRLRPSASMSRRSRGRFAP